MKKQIQLLDKLLFYFFALFAVSSTFSIAVAQLSLGVSLLLFLVILFLKKENPFGGNLKLFYMSIGLYIIWMILASLFGETPIESLFILKEEWLFCAIPIGIYLFQNESYRQKIFVSFAIAVGIISLYGIVQHFTGVHWFKSPAIEAYDNGYMVKGFFPHRLTYGNYFVVAMASILGYVYGKGILYSISKKLSLLLIVSLANLSILFSYSYGPILTIFIAFICFALLKFKKYTIIGISALIVISIGVFVSKPILLERIDQRITKEMSVENEASRIYIWQNAWKMIEENPIFGVGQGNFYSQFEKNMPNHRIHVHAHNDFINIAAIGGIPACLFYILIWSLYIRYTLVGILKMKHLKSFKPYFAIGLLGGIAFISTSLTEATFADEEVRQLLMFLIAFGLFPMSLPDKKEGN